MTVLKIDRTTGDLAVENGSWVSISGIEEVAQDVWLYLGIIRGELVFAADEGVPYVGEVTAAGTPAARLKSIFREAILSRPGVLSLLEGPDLDYDSNTRKLAVSFRADTDLGELVFTNETIDQGGA